MYYNGKNVILYIVRKLYYFKILVLVLLFLYVLNVFNNVK